MAVDQGDGMTSLRVWHTRETLHWLLYHSCGERVHLLEFSEVSVPIASGLWSN